MQIKVQHQGKTFFAEAQVVAGKMWVHFNGRTFSAENPNTQRSRKKGVGLASSDRIQAPMPGKITKIMVAQGQSVEPGTALLVMEAMKMEYTLKADVSGGVEQISCQVGDQVTLGQLLVKLQVDSEKLNL